MEETELGQLIPTDRRDIPCHTMSWSAIKAKRKKEVGEVHSYVSSQATTMSAEDLLFRKWLGVGLLMRNSE